MEIVKATLSDLKEIKIIEDEVFSLFHEERKEEDLIYEIQENPFSTFLLLKEEGKILGFINYWITFDSATINQIATRIDSRKKGVATALLHECEKHIKSENVEFLTLEVRENNSTAIALYNKFGFIKVTVKEKYYEDGTNAIYMVKGEI